MHELIKLLIIDSNAQRDVAADRSDRDVARDALQIARAQRALAAKLQKGQTRGFTALDKDAALTAVEDIGGIDPDTRGFRQALDKAIQQARSLGLVGNVRDLNKELTEALSAEFQSIQHGEGPVFGFAKPGVEQIHPDERSQFLDDIDEEDEENF